MQTSKQQYRAMSAAMRQLNPFGAVDGNGRPILFNAPREAYLHLFRSLRSEFPRGYVDLVLFSLAYQKLKKFQSANIIGKKEYAIIEWGGNSQQRETVLKAVCMKLLEVTGCQFDEQAFRAACFGDKMDMVDSGTRYERACYSLLEDTRVVSSSAGDKSLIIEKDENEKVTINFSESKYGNKEKTNQPETPKGNQEQQSPEHTEG